MIKINRDKKAIQIGELVIVKKWSPKKATRTLFFLLV